MKRLRGTFITMLLIKEVDHLEHDPGAQYKFNRICTIFWLFNMPLVVVLSVTFPRFWLQISVMYLIQASLWALVATHFGAMSASLAAINTNGTINNIADGVEDISGDVDTVSEALQPSLINSSVPSA